MAVLDWLQQLLGGGNQEMAPSSADQSPSDTSGIVLPYLQDVLSGKIAAGGLENTYDPNRSFAANALDPRGIEQATNLATAFSGGGLGIRAYHGSPHSFDRFDLSKIGTGEGAQAYGHGLYFAESEPVARSYRDALVNRASDDSNRMLSDNSSRIPTWMAKQIEQYPQGHEYHGAVIDNLETLLKGRMAEQNAQWSAQPWMAEANIKGMQEIIDHLGRIKSGDLTFAPTPKGSMYEVEINAKPEDFLNWDKPLAEQPADVLDRLRRLDPGITPEGLVPRLGAPRSPAGSEWITDLSGRSPAQTSEALGEAGIPGVRYLDQGSRAAGEGSSNYAIWTPEIITILRRYGLLPPLAAGGLLAAQPGEAAPQ